MVLLKLSPWLNIWVTWVLQKLLSALELIMLHSDSCKNDSAFQCKNHYLFRAGQIDGITLKSGFQIKSFLLGLVAQSLPANFCDRQKLFWIWQTMFTNIRTRLSLWRKIYSWIGTENVANRNNFVLSWINPQRKSAQISAWSQMKEISDTARSEFVDRQRQYFCSGAKDSWGSHDC